VQLWPGSSEWWIGVAVSGGSATTSKVEITDSSSLSSWTALTDETYAYVLDQSVELVLPISVRLTSSSGQQVTLSDFITSWTTTTSVNTGMNYGTSSVSTPAPSKSTSASTKAPAKTPAATKAPTITSPSTTTPSGVTVTVYPSASMWWFAVTVGGMDASTIASVEAMDSGSMTSYTALTYNPWGYSLNTQGAAFVAPVTVRITNTAGATVSATVTSITPSSAFTAN